MRELWKFKFTLKFCIVISNCCRKCQFQQYWFQELQGVLDFTGLQDVVGGKNREKIEATLNDVFL